MTSSPLESNLEWFKAHQFELAQLYEGMWLVIKDCRVIATFPDDDSAYQWRCRHFPARANICIYPAITGIYAYTRV